MLSFEEIVGERNPRARLLKTESERVQECNVTYGFVICRLEKDERTEIYYNYVPVTYGARCEIQSRNSFSEVVSLLLILWAVGSLHFKLIAVQMVSRFQFERY